MIGMLWESIVQNPIFCPVLPDFLSVKRLIRNLICILGQDKCGYINEVTELNVHLMAQS